MADMLVSLSLPELITQELFIKLKHGIAGKMEWAYSYNNNIRQKPCKVSRMTSESADIFDSSSEIIS